MKLIQKGFLCLFAGLLSASCTSGPIIRETTTKDPQTGAVLTSTNILMGGTLAAKRKGVVTQVKKSGQGGWTVSYMVDSESSESVPMTGLAAWASILASSDAASVSKAKEATAQHAASQQTAQHAAGVAAKTTVTTEAIKAGSPVTVGTITPP